MPGSENSSIRNPDLPHSTKRRPDGPTASKLHVVAPDNPGPCRKIPEQDHTESIASSTAAQISSISRLVLDTVGEGIFCVDASGCATFVNPAAARMTGWLPEELIGKPQHAMVHHSHNDGSPYPVENCQIYAALHGAGAHSREDEVFWRKDGTSFPVSYTSTPLVVDGVVGGAVVVFRDISQRTRRERWQRDKDEVLHAITVHRPVKETLQLLAEAYTAYQAGCAIAMLLRPDEDASCLTLVASSELSGALRKQLETIKIERGISACGHAAATGEEVVTDNLPNAHDASPMLETVGTISQRCLALPMTSANGEVLGVVAFIAAIGTPLRGPFPTALELPLAVDLLLPGTEHGGSRGVRDLAQIAVEHRNLQIELVRQSQHDRLTGLPNWTLLEDRLKHALRVADRTSTRVAICSIDLDRFRRINESFGHVVGDEVLRQVSQRFQRVLRSIDTLGRQAGDEFIVLLPELNDAADADVVCRRLLQATKEPFVVDGHSMVVGVNIGISIYPDHATTPEMLVQHADTALEFAKEKGQTKLKLFRPDLGEKVRQVAAREVALRTALERKEFFLMYQPLYDASRTIHGFEALLRWQHPELGLIPPDQFIPLAEETGLILPIGEWVLKEACRQAASWQPKSLANTKIFVNISGLQLGRPDFTQSVGYALRQTGLPPSRLELEVTESYIVPSFKKATARLQPLQDLGVSIAIDDFGTGHSSFSVLHKLPINAIKVDRSFVSRIDKDHSGRSTVRAIVNLAHQLGMKTVGEGVETEAQFSLLNDMECDYFQGYLLSKPLTVDAANLLFADRSAAVAPQVEPQVSSEMKISA